MKILYQAYDGELFKTERECLDYEKRKKRLKRLKEEFFNTDDLKFFNKQGERMLCTLEEMMICCAFIAVINEHGVNLLEYIDDEGFLIPKGIGLWFFDDIDNDWVEVHNPETVPKILVQYIRGKS